MLASSVDSVPAVPQLQNTWYRVGKRDMQRLDFAHCSRIDPDMKWPEG